MVFGMIPIDLMDPAKKEDVIIYIRNLPVDPRDRKRVLMNWCREMGVVLDEDMVRRANAE